MPRALTKQEREPIKEDLFQVAQEYTTAYGARKTTVDETVKRIKTFKGTCTRSWIPKNIQWFQEDYHD